MSSLFTLSQPWNQTSHLPQRNFPVNCTKRTLQELYEPFRCQKGKAIHQGDGVSSRTKIPVLQFEATEHAGKTQGTSLNLALDEN